jgi:hypothetical protein
MIEVMRRKQIDKHGGIVERQEFLEYLVGERT